MLSSHTMRALPVVRLAAASLAALALAGCSSRADPDRQAAAAPPPRDAGAAIDSSLRDHMIEHLAAVQRAQEAVMRGHLEPARVAAAWLAQHPEHVALTGDAAQIARVRGAAQALAEAPDLREAASVIASLGLACSACHLERGVAATFPAAPEPADGATLVEQMRRHEWASRELWQGLIGPSDERWRRGATTMAALRLDAGELARGPQGDTVRAAVARVRALASQAQAVAGQDERATLYGRMTEACVACHQAVRPQGAPLAP